MTPEEITQIIDILAERLGPMAEVVWAAYVRQVYIDAVRYVLIALVCFGVGAFLSYLARRLFKHSVDASGSKRDDYLGGMGACAFVAAVAFVAAILTLTDAMCALNPEYHAIQALLGR